MRTASTKLVAGCLLIGIVASWSWAQQFDRRRSRDRGFGATTRPYGQDQSGSGFSSVNSSGKPYPSEFSILLTRSIFSKDHLTTDPSAAPRQFDTRPRVPVAPVYRGVILEGDRFQATFENSTGVTLWLDTGESIWHGHIVEITLDHVVYEPTGGKRMTITIGQDLDGGTPSGFPSLGSSPLLSSSPPSSPASPSSSPSVTGSPTSGSGDSVIEAMRRRRQQEGGGQ